MGKNFSIKVDLAGLMAIGPLAKDHIFQNLATAVERVTMTGAERWQDAVMKAPLWDGERKAYAASIRWRMVSDYAGVIESDYKFVEDIETGRPAYDQKVMLGTSYKVRTSKKGRRYLVIPIRHNTSGSRAMPPAVYAAARKLAPSAITGQDHRVSGTGAYDIKTRAPYLVPQNKYKWGGRLQPGLAPKLKPHHKSDPFAGMYRFDSSSGKQTSSAYLNFRTMVEGSPGWIIPAKPGLFLAQKISTELQPIAEQLFQRAISEDIA